MKACAAGFSCNDKECFDKGLTRARRRAEERRREKAQGQHLPPKPKPKPTPDPMGTPASGSTKGRVAHTEEIRAAAEAARLVVEGEVDEGEGTDSELLLDASSGDEEEGAVPALEEVTTAGEGRGVCGLEGCSEPCHVLPAPAVGWFPYCCRSHGVRAGARWAPVHLECRVCVS